VEPSTLTEILNTINQQDLYYNMRWKFIISCKKIRG